MLVFRFPIAAIASISHRIAGMALFAGIAFALYGLQVSLASEQGFNQIVGAIGSPLGMIISIGLLAALAYHFVAGIKHLIMDQGIGETLEGGIFAARLTFLIAAILIFLAAIWVLQ